jgi:hypothetical protein
MLVQRTLDLKDKVAVVGRMTAEQRRELAALEEDVIAWQLRTGRNDISVSTSSPVRDDHLGPAAVDDGGSGSCRPCPAVTTMGTKVCFLVEEGPCRDGLIEKVCVYTCINLPGTIQPTRPKPPTIPVTWR